MSELCGYFFSDTYTMDPKTGANIAKKADPKALLIEVLPTLEGLDSFHADILKTSLEALADAAGKKVFAYFPALRYSVSGQGGGPDLLPMLAVMGRVRVIERIKRFIG
jgi:lysyl-tRNA synthetase class I